MRLERLRSAIDRVGPPLRRAGRFVRWLWGAVRSTLVFFAYLHPVFGILFGLALFYLAFVRLHPILSWLGLSEQAIGAIAGAAALAAFWVYGLRILAGVDVVAPFVRRLTPESTDDPERRDAAELASTLESQFERIVETETKLVALGRPTPETLSMTADERRRRATRLLAALEDDWAEVSRLASALEGKRRGGESGAETDDWAGHPPVKIRGHGATTWLSEARTRRERIGYWLESDPVEGGMLDTALLLDVGSPLLADESGPRADAETEAQSSSW